MNLFIKLKVIASIAFLFLFSVFSFANTVFVDKTGCVGNFINVRGYWENLQSLVRIERQKEGIKIYFKAYKSENYQPVLPAKVGDVDKLTLFNGEHVEIILNPSNKENEHYHLALSIDGKAIYHAWGTNPKAWNPQGIKVETKTEKDAFLVNVFIPYSQLNTVYPVNGTKWKANFVRTSAKLNSLASNGSWSGATNYHSLTQMGTLLFNEEKSLSPKVFIDNIKSDPVNGNMEITLHSNMPGIDVSLQSDDLENKDVKIGTSHKSFVLKSLNAVKEIPVKVLGTELTLIAKSANKILYTKSAHTIGANSNASDDIFKLSHYYIYPKDTKITYKVPANIEKLTTNVLDCLGKIVAKANNKGEILVDSLIPGRYIVEFSGIKDKVKFIARRVVIKVAPKAETKKANVTPSFTIEDHRLIKNGSPTYLIGSSCTKNKFYPQNPEWTLGGCHKNHPSSTRIIGLGGKRLIRKPYTAYLFEPQLRLEKYLDNFVRNLPKKSDSFVRIAYEADITPVRISAPNRYVKLDTFNLYANIYKRMKFQRPDVIYSLHTERMENVEKFLPFCDILEISSYTTGFHPFDVTYKMEAEFAKYQEMLSGKPAIFWIGGSIPNGLCRSAEEVRAATAYSMAFGFCGNVIHLGHGGLKKDRTRIWSVFSNLSNELNSYYNAFSSGSKTDYVVEVVNPKDFYYTVRSTGKEWYLMVINRSWNTKKFRMRLRVPVAQIEYVNENRIIPVVGEHQVFEEQFTGKEVRIFKLIRPQHNQGY
jgi:hypothetical protein